MALLTAHQLLFSVAAAGWGLALALSAARQAPRRRWLPPLRTSSAFLTLFGAIGAFHLAPTSITGSLGQAQVALVAALFAADVALALWTLRRSSPPNEAADG